jgi:probable rRNA maturation factor
LLAGDETVRQLNAIHLSEDAVTDVLSFPAINGVETEGFPAISGGWRDIGQIATSVPQANRQAVEQGHGLQDEVAHLIVHGVLHLLGFDHQEVVDEARMRQHEETLLREIAGISVGGMHKTKAHKALAGAPAGP